MGVVLSLFAAIWRLVFGQKNSVPMTSESVVPEEEFVEDVVAKASEVPVGQYVIFIFTLFFVNLRRFVLNRIHSQQTRNEDLWSDFILLE
jgi:hypothetical protein